MLNLKNKTAREEFVKGYRKWGVWKQIAELNLTFYRHDFANGAALVVTEYQGEARHKLSLILPADDDYTKSTTWGREMFRFYDPVGCGIGIIVDYMTKNKSVI